MDTQRINRFLTNIAAHNDREWFHTNKAEFDACMADFRADIDSLIVRLSRLDPEVGHLTAKECCYRFYRDVRFTLDKSPYKRHFGAYVCRNGRKSMRGGYYVHLQPGRSLLAFGCYCLPTNVLTQCRKEIVDGEALWREAVENAPFVRAFGRPGEGCWEVDGEVLTPKGFGLSSLRAMPKGYSKDHPLAPYLRMKNYCCWVKVDDDFFALPDWMERTARLAKTAQPMMRFINEVVDDYL